MRKAAILISCHKESDFLQSDIFQPIQVGCALTNVRIPNTLRDDTGDNISDLNKMYCELTAQYWAWKNLESEYYGFFHYRRYLSFKRTDAKYDAWGNICEEYIDTEMITRYGLDDETILGEIENYDVILPRCKDITKMPNMGRNMKEQYVMQRTLHQRDLEILNEVVSEKYPEFGIYLKKYEDGKYTYLNNMFIMRRELFLDYSAWLFDILEECVKRINFSDYSVEAIRTPGHLAERLLNVYVMYLKDQHQYHFLELDTVSIINTDPLHLPEPVFGTNAVAIALSANDFYVPYLSTLLMSIKEHVNSESCYDIMVMHRDISKHSQMMLTRMLSDYENISLRFFDVGRFHRKYENLFTRGHFVMETYFRLLMPDLMPEYSKVLYLDSDMIVKADVADLYNIDVKGYLLAACHDADTAGLYNGFEPNKKYYMDNILKIHNPYEYFQAGTILFNLEEIRKTYSSDDMLRFAASYQWELLDQDVLNYLAQGRYKAIDMAWNVMYDWENIRINQIISRAPKYLQDEYMCSRRNPKIIHYAGPTKPWSYPFVDYAVEFWYYARKTPYYEVIIRRMAEAASHEQIPPAPSKLFLQKLRSVIKKIAKKIAPQYSFRRKVVRMLLGR